MKAGLGQEVEKVGDESECGGVGIRQDESRVCNGHVCPYNGYEMGGERCGELETQVLS